MRMWPGIALIASFIATVPLRAAWNDLGPTQQLGEGITPGIAVEPGGTIHVVFMRGGEILHRRSEGGGAFGPATRVPAPEKESGYNSPHLICDARGVVHLAFGRLVTGAAKRAWYANYRDGKWSQPVLALDVAGTERRVNYPRLDVTRDGSAAYVAGFVGGASLIARLEGLDSAPRVTGRVETRLWAAHPLVTRSGDVLVVGRAGASGHKLERYSRELERRDEPVLLSRDTPTKTYEATAAILDDRGIVHAIGAAGSPVQRLWYTTSERAAAGRSVVLGPEFGHDIGERTYPLMLRDARGRLLISYRDHATGESKLTMLEPDGATFATPIAVAPAITSRLRWNAHLAAAPAGGAYVVWDMDERVYFRAVGEAAKR